MKISYNWLSKYVDISDISPYDLAEKLTRSGVAVDIVERRSEGLAKVVVGHVDEKEQHPNADKLSLCMVDVGEEEPLQIICGAANVAKGQKVPVALVGAVLPDGLKIKKAKLRGVLSEGMICSAKELGMDEKLLSKDKTEGILVLPDDSDIGQEIEPVLGLDDYILELDLTPNRSDCLSFVGVAYEVAAILDRNVKLPQGNLGLNVNENHSVKVKINAEEGCTHYAARLLTNVKIEESPQWLQNRLIGVGIRPINNVVDITNFVMLEYGQPLHAFDYEYLDQPEILVRMAQPNEKIVTLDEQERELDEQMLLITDGVKPIAIAGVMGGANSEVTNETTKILLESAYFKGYSVRRTSKKLGLRSEASLRFEKGIDPNRIYTALNRAAELLQEIAGAKVEGDITEHITHKPEEAEILVEADRINKSLGTQILPDEMKAIFKRLEFNIEEQNNGMLVKVPTRRPDITIEADLVEEVARIYGYDNIPTTLPSGDYIQGGLSEEQKIRRSIKRLLEASGLEEVVTYTLSNQKQLNLVQGLNEQPRPINLSMPMSEDRKILRTALIPHLLDVAQYNFNHRNFDVRIYELGATFITDEINLTQLPKEKWVISGLLTGSLAKSWIKTDDKIDFYYVKGILEDLFDNLGITDIEYELTSLKGYHPGRTAAINVAGKLVGYIGQLHPKTQALYDLEETYVFELDLKELMEKTDTDIAYQSLPKYPAIQRDIAVVVPNKIEAKALMETIYENAGKLLESLNLFDVYTSDNIGTDKKSIALSITYRSADRTLTDEEVTKFHDKVLNSLQEKYQAELRK